LLENWPKTKKELERGMQSARKVMEQAEKQFKILSEKSAKSSKKLQLSLKREKAYHELGKLTAKTSRPQWSQSKKINTLVRDVKKLDRQIKNIK